MHLLVHLFGKIIHDITKIFILFTFSIMNHMYFSATHKLQLTELIINLRYTEIYHNFTSVHTFSIGNRYQKEQKKQNISSFWKVLLYHALIFILNVLGMSLCQISHIQVFS